MLQLLQERGDARAVARALAGDAEAFEALIERHGTAALAVARGLVLVSADAEDVVQDAFIKAYQKLDTLQQPKRFGAWFLTIVRNSAIRLRERRLREVPLEHTEEPVEDAATGDAELERIIRKGISGLDADQREILSLYHFAGKSIQECARLQETSYATAAKRLQRARQALGTELVEALGPEAREVFALDARKRKMIFGAVLAAGASWHAGATSSGAIAGAGGTGAVLKLALGGAMVVGTILAATFTVPDLIEGLEAGEAGVKVTTSQLPRESEDRREQDVPERSATGKAPDPGETQPAESGVCSIAESLITFERVPVPDAMCALERITWEPTEIPPAKTQRWTVRADANGRVVFRNLPYGTYCLSAVTAKTSGLESYTVSEENPNYSDNELLMMPIAHNFRGMIVNEAGDPVENAWLYPFAHERYPNAIASHTRVASARGHSDSTGAFIVPTTWLGGMKYFIYAEGYAPLLTDYVPHTRAPRFVLNRGVDVDVSLVNEESGEPIPGTTLIMNLASRVTHKFTTDAFGQYRLTGAAIGTYDLSTDDPALILSGGRRITLEADQELRIGARVGGVVMGRVTDQETGAGIPGVEVECMGTGKMRAASTDSNGEYMIMGLAAGTAHLRLADKPGYHAGMQQMQSFYHQTVNIMPGAVLENVDMVLYPAARIQGVVVGRRGKPVRQAQVQIHSVQGGSGFQATKVATETDLQGRFSFESLPEDTRFVLRAQKAADASSSIAIASDANETQDIRIVLDQDASGSIRGTVGGPGGSLLPGATLDLQDQDGFSWRAETLATGVFSVENLPAGVYTTGIMYRIPGPSRTYCPDSRQIEVRAGEHKTDVRVTCGSEGTLMIRGTVLRPDGRPKASAEVTIPQTPYIAITDVRGAFELRGLEEKNYSIVALARGFAASDQVTVMAGESGVTIYLNEMVTVTGRVTDALTGVPLSDFQVRVFDDMDGPLVKILQDGKFEIRNISQRDVSVHVSAPGYLGDTQRLDLAPSQREAALDFALPSESRVSGRVVLPDGTAVPGVSISQVPNQETVTTVSGGDGRFEIKGLRHGVPTNLFLFSEDYGTTHVLVTPGKPQEENLTVVLQEGAAIETYIMVNGEAAARYAVTVSASNDDGRSYQMTLLMDQRNRHFVSPGHYKIDTLPAGPTEITIHLVEPQVFTMEELNSPETFIAPPQTIQRSLDLNPGETTVIEHHFDSGDVMSER